MSKVQSLPPEKKSATKPEDVALLRLHSSFDDIQDTLIQTTYQSDELKRALDLIKWARVHTVRVFLRNVIESRK